MICKIKQTFQKFLDSSQIFDKLNRVKSISGYYNRGFLNCLQVGARLGKTKSVCVEGVGCGGVWWGVVGCGRVW